MADSGLPNRPSRGSGSLTVHLADELDVYFNEVAHGRPVGFVASPKWKPRTDVYETDEQLIVHMDIAGMVADDFSVELIDGILKIAGERIPRQQGTRHYHSMEVQIGPFERRLDRKSTRLNSSHFRISYAVFCLKKNNPLHPR